jgi:hypothetical protein
MKNNNPYSKYRYDNTSNLKYRSDDHKVQDVFGGALKGYNNLLGKQMDEQVASSFPGIDWVVANVFKAQRITNVDTSIIPSTYKRPIYFKPFKL